MSLEKNLRMFVYLPKTMNVQKYLQKLRVKTLLNTLLTYLKKKSQVSGMYLIYKQNHLSAWD